MDGWRCFVVDLDARDYLSYRCTGACLDEGAEVASIPW